MTIQKTNYSSSFERAAGSYTLDISLPGCVGINKSINVSQDTTINETLMAGSAALTFVMPSVATAAHRDDTDKVELYPLTKVSGADDADIAIADGEWLEPADAPEGALFFIIGTAVATELGYTGDKLTAPTYTISGEQAANYADLSAPKYFMLKSTYKYMSDQRDLVTVNLANFTDNAGLSTNASSATQDFFILTVIVNGPSEPIVTVE